jgi:MinD-like ATPase involved in chromosome partitioning or flagellar assembly
MVVRFDDSLDILTDTIVKRLGSDALCKGVTLRDASGRLAFFSASALDRNTQEELSKELRNALGVYGRTDRIVATPDDSGISDALTDPLILNMRVGLLTVRLLDRRLVGADWLRRPALAAEAPPRFVFTSLKGGVGRSTALSVAAAAIAARGCRVLTIDMDLEAPGLGSMLLADDELPEFGLIDALAEDGLAPLDREFFADLRAPSSLADHRGRIDVVPAFGRRSLCRPANVLAKIARAYMEDIRPDGTVSSILDQVASIVEYFSATSDYHAILIDARAGLHETTAAAILGLGADLLLFGLNERQTFIGYSALFSHLALFIDPNMQRPEWLERITMVQGRASVELQERQEFAAKCQQLYESCGLVLSTKQENPSVELPAEPFGDVPWDDEAANDQIALDEPIGPRPTISVLDDERFRLFNPQHRSDLLSPDVYNSSYGALIKIIAESISAASGDE